MPIISNISFSERGNVSRESRRRVLEISETSVYVLDAHWSWTYNPELSNFSPLARPKGKKKIRQSFDGVEGEVRTSDIHRFCCHPQVPLKHGPARPSDDRGPVRLRKCTD